MFESCPNCPVGPKPKVPHEMRPMSDVIFVGESPGREELYAGRPFVGPSGRLLRPIVPENTYRVSYVNTLMCSVDSVKQHLKINKTFCYDMLWAYIYEASREGTVVIPLGAVAAKALGLTKAISKLVNTSIIKRLDGPNDEVKNVLICPAFHPAYILRNEEKRKEWTSSVQAAMAQCKERKGLDIEIHTDLDSFLAVPDGTLTALDTETDGVNVVLSRAHYLSLSTDGHNCWVFKLDVVPVARLFDRLMRMKLVLAGSDFDLPILARKQSCLLEAYGDVQVAEHVLDERNSTALETLTFRYLGVPAFKAPMHSWLQENGLGPADIIKAPPEIILPYAANDAAATWLVIQKQVQKLREQNLYEYYRQEMSIQNDLIQMHLNGVHINQEYRAKLSQEYATKATGLAEKIDNWPSVLLWRINHDAKEFNPRSTKQLGEVLYGDEYEGLTCMVKTDKGTPSVSLGALHPLTEQCELIQIILDHRRTKRFLNTFIDGLLVYQMKGDTFCYPRPRLTGPRTARISMSDPNLQQLPWQSDIRAQVNSRFPKGMIIPFDYKQLELRIVAVLAKADNMLEVFANNGDIHKVMAGLIYKISPEDVTDWQRHHAKSANFGLIYGQTPEGLVKAYHMILKDARFIHDAWRAQNPKIVEWQLERQNFGLRYGYVLSPNGRRRWIDYADPGAPRKAVNSPIQSQGADICLDGMGAVAEYIRMNNMESKVILQVHDEVLVDAHPDEVERLQEVIPELATGHYDWSPIEFPIDMSIGDSWGSVKEMTYVPRRLRILDGAASMTPEQKAQTL